VNLFPQIREVAHCGIDKKQQVNTSPARLRDEGLRCQFVVPVTFRILSYFGNQ